VPVHTHVDSTQFAHPLVPTMGELNQLADDFKVFLMAVMVGVLKRSTQRNLVPAGQYEFEVSRGDVLKVGNERAFRQNGLPLAYRDAIAARVSDRIFELEAVQLLALAELASHFSSDVYAPRLQPDETGAETPIRGFASAIAGAAATELRQKALALGANDALVTRVRDQFRQHLSEWSTAVPGSDADAYEWEVREQSPGNPPRLKLVANAAFFDSNRMKSLFELGPDASARSAGSVAAAGFAQQPPPLPGSAQYWFGLEHGQSGPFDMAQVRQLVAEGRLNEGTLTWKAGWADWQSLRMAPELVALLQSATGGAVPPKFPGAGR